MAIFSYLQADQQATASDHAAADQTKMMMYALAQDQARYEQARAGMQPYSTMGLMGMERLVGTQPMQRTMGGNAQQMARQQMPVFEDVQKQLNPPPTNEEIQARMREQYKNAAPALREKAVGMMHDQQLKLANKTHGGLSGPANLLKVPLTPKPKNQPFPIQKRQYGGPVRQAQPYLVGEAGPEVVVPQQNGTVIPNQRNLLGGGANYQPQGGPGPNPTGNNILGGGTQWENFMDKLRGSPAYMMNKPTQGLMDWMSNAQAQPTTPQPGLLEQGPPPTGPMPTRQEFDFAAMQESPWYQQPLQQGIDAIQRSAIGQGGLYSGATGQALNKFGQDYAFSKYMPARQQALGESESDFNRWLQGNQFGLNRWLQGELQPAQEMVRVGQASAAGQATNALNNSQYQGNLLSNIGSAQASGTLGQASAYGGMYGNYANLLGQGAGMGLGALMMI